MPTNDAGNAAERLDALWDRLIAGEAEPAHPSDGADAAFIATLMNQTPRLGEPARHRIRHRVFASTEGATTAMSAPGLSLPNSGDLIAPIPNSSRPAIRPRFIDQPLLRVAAMLLLAVSLVGGWAIFRDDGDGPLRGITHFPAGHLASNDSTPSPAVSEPIDGPMIWSVAPTELDLPDEETEVRLLLNEVTIEPGASWEVPYDTANLLRVISGNLTITGRSGSNATELTAGTQASFGSGVALTLANHGTEPVVLTHGLVLLPDAGEFTADLPTGVAVEPLSLGSLFASGPVTVMLSVQRISPTGTQATAHGEMLDYRLYTVLSGSINVTRQAGTMGVQRHGEAPMPAGTLEAIGDEIELLAGDSLFAHSHSAYRIESIGAEPAQVALIAMHTRLVPEVSASPVASPIAETPLPSARSLGSLIRVVPGDCTIEARSINEFEAILADPFVNGTPTAHMHADAGPGVPADEETIAGVTDTIVQIVACNSPVSMEMYSLYSANALRFQAMHGMTINEIDSLPAFEPGEYPDRVLGHVVLEDVTILPDGRVTAMVSANNEIAFVTFVFENGRWLIDFWDDSFED